MLQWIMEYTYLFWMLSFKPVLSFSSFTFIKRLFSSSLLSAIRVVSFAYLRLLIFLPAILIPVCALSSSVFFMMYSAYKLNKQGDNIQHWHSWCIVYIIHSYLSSKILHEMNLIDFISLLDIAYSTNTLYLQVLMSNERLKGKWIMCYPIFPFLSMSLFLAQVIDLSKEAKWVRKDMMAWSLMFVRTQWLLSSFRKFWLSYKVWLPRIVNVILLCYNVAHLYALCLFFYYLFYFFLNWGIGALPLCLCFCYTMKWISYIYIYIYIYTHTHPLPPTYHPTPLRHHRAPSCAPCTIQHVSTSNHFYTWQCTYVSPNFPIPPTPYPPLGPHINSLCLCLYCCPANTFIYTIFLGFIYMH